jgi:hypothetical protein
LDLRARDLTPFLKDGFACLFNVLASGRVIDTNPLAVLNIGWCSYLVDVCLQNEAPWARITPEVFDGGNKNSVL